MLEMWGKEEKERGDRMGRTVFAFPSPCCVRWSPDYLEKVEHLPAAHLEHEILVLLVYMAFTLPFTLSFID